MKVFIFCLRLVIILEKPGCRHLPYFADVCVYIGGPVTRLADGSLASRFHSVQDMTEFIAEFKLAAIASTFQGCRLFAGLCPSDIQSLAGIVLVKALDKGEYVFHEGEPTLGFYIIQKGSINIHRVNASGKEQVIHVFRAGDSFAEAALTMSGYPADARAIESAQVLLVRKAEFMALLGRRPELALRMFASLSAHVRVLVGQLEDMTLRDVETRLMNWLVKRCPDPKSGKPYSIHLAITKRALAAELGTVSETFSRTLAKLREQGLVEVKGKAVTILAPARLSEQLRKSLGE
jgi:CRP/FNR family transcriptional regulator, dissimilatory nitrate respiration regulator